MNVLDKMFNPHLDRLGRALDRTTQRMGLLAENMANVNTPGYKRQDVDFAIELDEAENGPRLRPLGGPPPGNSTNAVRVDGSGVDLEKEVTAIAETELRYAMLTEMTARYFSGLRNAIREGR